MANYVSKSTLGEQQGEGKRKLSVRPLYDALAGVAKGNLIGGFLISFVLLLFVSLFVFIFEIGDAFRDEWKGIVNIILFSLPVLSLLLSLYFYWRDLKRLSNGEYSVVTDTVVDIREEIKYKYTHRGYRHVIEQAMYLSRFGRKVITREESSIFSKGDVFYAVVRDKHPNRAILLYNSKFYELEDIEAK